MRTDVSYSSDSGSELVLGSWESLSTLSSQFWVYLEIITRNAVCCTCSCCGASIYYCGLLLILIPVLSSSDSYRGSISIFCKLERNLIISLFYVFQNICGTKLVVLSAH